MSDEQSPPSVDQRLAELTERLDRLQRELERRRRPPLIPRPPRAEELRQFTTDVAIPGLILLLETNVRALKLFQRTLRTAEASESRGSAAADRASELGAATLARLDSALEEAQSVLAAEPPDSEARELLEDARTLQTEIQNQLTDDELDTLETGPGVDIEAELQSIKDQVDADEE